MEPLEHLAVFFQTYGGYAIAAYMSMLYWVERRERIQAQAAHVQTLSAMTDKATASLHVVSEATATLERVMLRAGIEADHENS